MGWPKGKPLSPEHRAAISAAMAEPALRAGISARMSAANVARWQDPTYRAQQSAARTRPEHRARLSAAMSAAMTDPAVRARISAANKGNTHVRDASVKGDCVWCGKPGTEYDHVVPRGRPGWDAPDNVVVACRSCNSGKKNRTPDEWWAQMTQNDPKSDDWEHKMAIPRLKDLDLDALSAAVAEQFQALPDKTKEHLTAIADRQGGFPWSIEREATGVRVVWADIIIAWVPYELVRRRPSGPVS